MEIILKQLQEQPLWKSSIERIFPNQNKLPLYIVPSTELFDVQTDLSTEKNKNTQNDFVQNILMVCRSPPVNPEYARACIEHSITECRGRNLWLAMTWQHFVRDVRNDFIERQRKERPSRQSVLRLINKHLPFHLYGFLVFTEHAKSVHPQQPLVSLDLICAAYLWRQGKRFHEHNSPELKNPAIQHLLQPPPIRGRVGDALLCVFLLAAMFRGYVWCALEVAVPADEKSLKHYGEHRELPSVATLIHRYEQFGFVEIKALATHYQLFSDSKTKFPSMICHLKAFKDESWWLTWYAVATDPERKYGLSPCVAQSFIPHWLLKQKKKKINNTIEDNNAQAVNLQIDVDDYECASILARSS